MEGLAAPTELISVGTGAGGSDAAVAAALAPGAAAEPAGTGAGAALCEDVTTVVATGDRLAGDGLRTGRLGCCSARVFRGVAALRATAICDGSVPGQLGARLTLPPREGAHKGLQGSEPGNERAAEHGSADVVELVLPCFACRVDARL